MFCLRYLNFSPYITKCCVIFGGNGKFLEINRNMLIDVIMYDFLQYVTKCYVILGKMVLK